MEISGRNETEARSAARKWLGVKRLPRNSSVGAVMNLSKAMQKLAHHRGQNHWAFPAKAFEHLESRYSDEVLRLSHKGWYADREFQEGVYRGEVLRLPDYRGQERYLATYLEVNAEYRIVEATAGEVEIYDIEDYAARWADELARIHAECSADWREAENERAGYADDVTQLSEEILERIWAWGELRNQDLDNGAAGRLIQKQFKELRAERKEQLRKQIEAAKRVAEISASNERYFR